MHKYKGMKNLKIMRIKRNLTQKQLAEKVGVKYMTISYYEVGVRYPRRDILEKLAEALDCEIKDIV